MLINAISVSPTLRSTNIWEANAMQLSLVLLK